MTGFANGRSVSVTDTFDEGTKPYVGGGIQFFLTENFALQGEYTFYQGDAVDASLFSDGLTWDF